MHPTPMAEPNPQIVREIIVKMRPNADPDIQSMRRNRVKADKARVNHILAMVPGITMHPLYPTEITRNQYTMLAPSGSADRELLPVEALSDFYKARITQGQPLDEIIERLNDQPEVEYAYLRHGPAPPPDFHPENDPLAQRQGYLSAAPLGINLAFAQTFPGGDGRGVTFLDIEQGWTLNHEDLIDANIKLKWGVNRAYFGHGTAVLGQVVAADNTRGIIGIARGCTPLVISQWKTNQQYTTNEAILKAVKILNPGDVMLIEAQVAVPDGSSQFFPVEIEGATLNALRIAYNKGIIVIEAAGNGGNDLDEYWSPGQGKVLNRQSPDFAESGAILVGAASADVSHQRLPFSNYGSRIDCFGWGNNIVTTGDGYTGQAVDTYTHSFGGTSGASPIIAGVAILVQSIQRALGGASLMPEDIRAFLSDPRNGTSSANPATDRIGCMPDLEKLLANLFRPVQ